MGVLEWHAISQRPREMIEQDHFAIQDRGREKRRAQARWTEVALGDLVEIKHGFAFKGVGMGDEPRGDVLLTPGNFAIGGGFKGDKYKYYYGDVPEEFVLSHGDFLVTMTDLSKQSDTLGYPALVPSRTDNRRYLHNQRLGKVILKGEFEVDKRFLYYVMCSSDYRHEVLASATGTTVKHTSPDRVKQFRFKLPPLPEQRAIASVLGALDDKIELNRRMNETLEQMARALFKSWFVDFDPVRAKMAGRWRRGESLPGLPARLYEVFPSRLVPCELGPIPDGWQLNTLGTIANQRRVGVHPDHIDPSTPYIALEHMPKRCVALSAWGTSDGLASGKFRFKQGDILFGKLRPYFHKVGVAPLDGVCSTDIVVMSPSSPCWFGLVLGYVSSSEFVDYTDAASTGTKMPRTKWVDMARYKIALPSQELARSFNRMMLPCIDSMRFAIHESRILIGQRDALLPEILSGHLRLGDQSHHTG